jgi:hypothetical protein
VGTVISALAKIEWLWRRTPAPQSVRLAGCLDSLCLSDRAFTLVLASGETVRGLAVGVEPRDLAVYFGESVLVAGRAVFRPSGSVLRIEAEEVEPAAGDIRVWSRMPVPIFRRLDLRTLHQPQGPRSGINALIGRWPGDESDEEVLELLEEIS